MIKYHEGDDIKLKVQIQNRGEVINPSEVRWTVRVYTESRDKAVLCTHDDSGYSNCYVTDNYIVLAIDNPELVSGILRVMITLYYEDEDMSDGYRTESVMMREVENLNDSIAEGVADISVVGYSAYRIAVLHYGYRRGGSAYAGGGARNIQSREYCDDSLYIRHADAFYGI